MFFLKGTRTVRIKTYKDHEHECPECKDFDLTVKVYRPYFHIMFIPMVPTGFKTVDIRCDTCGAPFRVNSLKKEYESKTRTPFYFYTIIILFSLFFAVGIIDHLLTERDRGLFASNPQVGDVYMIRRDSAQSAFYHFIRVARVNGDSVITYAGHLEYSGYVTAPNQEDYFDSGDELYYTKNLIEEMYKKDIINNVIREYNPGSGFNRVK